MIKAFVFDFDGVILYTPGVSRAVWKESFKNFGIEFTDDDYKRFQGIRSVDKIKIILEDNGKYTESLAEDILRFREKLKITKMTTMSNDNFKQIVVPGSIDFLKEVKKMGFKMGLATSSLESTAIPSLERIGIKSLFDAFVFGDHVEKGKPSPDIYLLAAKRLGIEPESCLVFEDALNGIKSAKSAGMRVIALNTNDNEEKLVTENPEKIINNFEGVSVKSLVE